MDITKLNFLERLPLISAAISSADFIAFDSEFSGLSVCYEDNHHDYETDEDRYLKIRNNCQRMNAF